MTKKKIKMLVYGEPGVGKSVFASQFPKPFFLTTDGNYEWLEDFGAKPEANFKLEDGLWTTPALWCSRVRISPSST